MDFDHQKSLCQLHQFVISCDMVEGLHADVSVSIQTLKDNLGPSCQAAFTGVPACPPFCESAASERYTAGHGSVGGGRISMPKVWLLDRHAGARHASQCNEQHRGYGRVGSGVRRALSFFDVQVASWWDLDEVAAS